MKYTTEIIIKIPLTDFLKKLQNPKNLKHWQRGFIRYDYISGVPGDIGSKMKLVYKSGKRETALEETVIYKQFPHKIQVMYDTDGMQRIQENYFSETPELHTKWTSITECIPMNFRMRMFILLMPGILSKQTKQYMQDFKNFAENGTSINNEKT